MGTSSCGAAAGIPPPLIFSALPGCDQDRTATLLQLAHFYGNPLLEIGNRKIDADGSGFALDSPHKILAIAPVKIQRASLRRAAALGCQSHHHWDPLAIQNLNGAVLCPSDGIRSRRKLFVCGCKVEGYRGVNLPRLHLRRGAAKAESACEGRGTLITVIRFMIVSPFEFVCRFLLFLTATLGRH